MVADRVAGNRANPTIRGPPGTVGSG
jgi:hypothetical protein